MVAVYPQQRGSAGKYGTGGVPFQTLVIVAQIGYKEVSIPAFLPWEPCVPGEKRRDRNLMEASGMWVLLESVTLTQGQTISPLASGAFVFTRVGWREGLARGLIWFFQLSLQHPKPSGLKTKHPTCPQSPSTPVLFPVCTGGTHISPGTQIRPANPCDLSLGLQSLSSLADSPGRFFFFLISHLCFVFPILTVSTHRCPISSPFHCGRNFPSQFQHFSPLPSHPPTPAGLGFLKRPSGVTYPFKAPWPLPTAHSVE